LFRHLIRIDRLKPEEVEAILTLARVIKDKTKRGIAHRTLEGKILAMIFEKSSTRTRVSFDVGMYQMGGIALYIDAFTTQMGRGESLGDTAQVLSRYVNGLMIRAHSHDSVEEFAKHATVPVINGLTDRFHPCQVLSDLFTIQEKLGDLRGLRIAYIGDGNNVANSWINAARVMGFELVLACPEGYEPDERLLDGAGNNITLERDPSKAVEKARVIYTDVWVSMGQEGEEAERIRIFAPYQVNETLMGKAPTNVIMMHCLPAHRGQEVTSGVMDGPRSIVFDQAENRLHVQKAILELLMGSHKPKVS
jgi:ornithine carbamoyltransferase